MDWTLSKLHKNSVASTLKDNEFRKRAKEPSKTAVAKQNLTATKKQDGLTTIVLGFWLNHHFSDVSTFVCKVARIAYQTM